MNSEIKKYADSGDIKSLKYIFVDSLDVDPTFVRYEEEYNYCKSIPGLLESHIELTPFRTDKADWNEDYWTSLKMDLVKNFSDRRMSHMREVAKVFLADKVQRILAERASSVSVKKNSEQVTGSIRRQAHVSKAAEQARELEEAKRKLEAENRAQAEREAKEKGARIAQLDKEKEKAGGGSSKKVVGVAVAAVAVAVVAVAVVVILK